MDPETELWRKYLRKDPTRFLLDAEGNPSVYLWYLIDIAHRPDDAVVVLEAREHVLYSQPVQEILEAQNGEGYWAQPTSLARPYYRATVWNLALLAELGIPRHSRRARTACEYALENFLEGGGRFAGLDFIETGYLIHALAYFRPASDERVLRAARALVQPTREADSFEGSVMALWAWADFRHDAEISGEADTACERLLESLAVPGADALAPITNPPFDPRDALFILRVLAIHNCANDPRAGWLVQSVLAKQDEQSRWPLEKALDGSMTTQLEEQTSASRWATLTALRLIVKLVTSARD